VEANALQYSVCSQSLLQGVDGLFMMQHQVGCGVYTSYAPSLQVVAEPLSALLCCHAAAPQLRILTCWAVLLWPQVVKEAYPDPTSWDAKGKYYDPKSTPEEPRWFMVDWQLVRRTQRQVRGSRQRNDTEGAMMHSCKLLA
jgi:hypothetical protein